MSEVAVETRVAASTQRLLARTPATITEIPAGLGRRRFFRVALAGEGGPASVVARVEFPEDPARRPAGVPPEPALEPLRTFLASAGLPVPGHFGTDAAEGIEFLEDLGSLSLAAVVGGQPPAVRRALYAEACDLVPRLQRVHAPAAQVPAFGRHLDGALFAYKADFFVRWSLPQALGRPARPAEADVVYAAFRLVEEASRAAPERLAHRDFQGANLLLREGAPPGARIAMIDIQGAFLAPPEYDLVCLLRDSYVELEESEVVFHTARVRETLPDAPAIDTFSCRFDLLTLTRKGKDHALGLYHAELRRDPGFARYAPTCARYLRSAAARLAPRDARLARFAELVDRLPAGSDSDPLQPQVAVG